MQKSVFIFLSFVFFAPLAQSFPETAKTSKLQCDIVLEKNGQALPVPSIQLAVKDCIVGIQRLSVPQTSITLELSYSTKCESVNRAGAVSKLSAYDQTDRSYVAAWNRQDGIPTLSLQKYDDGRKLNLIVFCQTTALK